MSNEWYTPQKYVDAAREVFGGTIDLDPASCALANQTVRAARYYTQEDNGLMHPWYGNVWLNPPYGQTNIGSVSHQRLFTEKLLREPIEQAVLLLLGSAPYKKWFQPLWNYPICFQKACIFLREDGRADSFGFGTCFVYLGMQEQRFIDVFSQFGRIAKAVDVPVAKPRQLELVS